MAFAPSASTPSLHADLIISTSNTTPPAPYKLASPALIGISSALPCALLLFPAPCSHKQQHRARLPCAQYTIAAWIRPVAPGNQYGGIVGWGTYGSANAVNALRMQGYGRIANYWWGHDLSTPPHRSVDLRDGEWHHVAVRSRPPTPLVNACS